MPKIIFYAKVEAATNALLDSIEEWQIDPFSPFLAEESSWHKNGMMAKSNLWDLSVKRWNAKAEREEQANDERLVFS